MLKSVLYYLMLAVTVARLADLVYLLGREATNLPVAVLVSVSVLILYGIVLGVKRFVGSVRLGHLMAFFLVETLAICFNLFYVATYVPLKLDLWEMLIVGSFLEILINLVAVYLCLRHRRSRFVTVGGME